MKKILSKRLLRGFCAVLAAAVLFTAFALPGASAATSDGLTIATGGYLYKITRSAPFPNEVKLVQYPIQVDYSSYTGALEIPGEIAEDVLGFPVKYTVTEIGGAEGSFPGALEGVHLTSVKLPGTVETIGTRAFAASSISDLTFSTSVNSMAADAFTGTHISTLTLDVTVEATLQGGASYTTSGRVVPLQLPGTITNLKATEALLVTGDLDVPGNTGVSKKITIAGGASLTTGSLSGSGAIDVADRGRLVLNGGLSGYSGQIRLMGSSSFVTNNTSSVLRIVNASGNSAAVQPGETASGGQVVNPGTSVTWAQVRPQITANEGGTVAVRENGKVIVISAFAGYHVESVTINGLPMGSITRYEFQAASKDNTVAVTFAGGQTTEGPQLPADDPVFLFKDVDTKDWYADAVSFMVRNKIFVGVSEDEFAPKEETTRAMFVTLLYRLDDYDDKYSIPCSSPAPLTDIRLASWYAKAAKWAVGIGVSPISGTEFQPRKIITREEIAVYLYNFTKALGGSLAANEGILDSYADKDQIAPEAKEAMAWAVTNGYLTGRSGDLLDPYAGAMRSEIAEILRRYLITNM